MTTDTRFPNLFSVLEGLGIDPAEVPEDGLSTTGYYTLAPVGHVTADGGSRMWHPWPTPHAGDLVFQAMIKDNYRSDKV